MQASESHPFERESLFERLYMLILPVVAIGVSIYFISTLGSPDLKQSSRPVLAISPVLIGYTLVLWVGVPGYLVFRLLRKRRSRPQLLSVPHDEIPIVHAKRTVVAKDGEKAVSSKR